MNEKEIREASRILAFIHVGVKLDSKQVGAILELQSLAQQYLEVKGLPEEGEEYKQDEDGFGNIYTRKREGAIIFNQAIHLCKLAQIKKCQECGEKE